MEVNLSTNQVLLCLLGVWSIGFWVCGWVANRRRKSNDSNNIIVNSISAGWYMDNII